LNVASSDAELVEAQLDGRELARQPIDVSLRPWLRELEFASLERDREASGRLSARKVADARSGVPPVRDLLFQVMDRSPRVWRSTVPPGASRAPPRRPSVAIT
jgi:hypothetical protein